MKDEYLMILYVGLEAGAILRKNAEGNKAWTKKDITRAYKKGYITGYDVSVYSDSLCTVTTDFIQCMYITDEVPTGDEGTPGFTPQTTSDKMFG